MNNPNYSNSEMQPLIYAEFIHFYSFRNSTIAIFASSKFW